MHCTNFPFVSFFAVHLCQSVVVELMPYEDQSGRASTRCGMTPRGKTMLCPLYKREHASPCTRAPGERAAACQLSDAPLICHAWGDKAHYPLDPLANLHVHLQRRFHMTWIALSKQTSWRQIDKAFTFLMLDVWLSIFLYNRVIQAMYSILPLTLRVWLPLDLL